MPLPVMAVLSSEPALRLRIAGTVFDQERAILANAGSFCFGLGARNLARLGLQVETNSLSVKCDVLHTISYICATTKITTASKLRC